MASSTKQLKKKSKPGKSGKPKKKSRTAKSFSAEAISLALDSPNGAGDIAFSEWSEYLAARKKGRLNKLLGCKSSSPLFWCLPIRTVDQLPAMQLLRFGAKTKNGGKKSRGATTGLRGLESSHAVALADQWLQTPNPGENLVHSGLEALTWTSLLPRLSQLMPRNTWNDVLRKLVLLANESTSDAFAADNWAEALLRCELPLLLAFQFPEIPRCTALIGTATQRLSSQLELSMDGAGLPHARDLDHLQPLFASWTRSVVMAESLDEAGVGGEAMDQYEWLVRQVLRFARQDGANAFQPETDSPDLPGLEAAVKAGLSITRDPEDRSLCRMILGGKEVSDSRLPEEPSIHSEWAEVAVLQPEWSPLLPRLTVDFSQPELRIELSTRGHLIAQGPWNPEIHVDGQRLAVTGEEWESVCWFSDYDADYLELEISLSGGWTLQRQLLMARQDMFLFSADVLLGDSPGKIEYESKLPLLSGVTTATPAESREVTIQHGRTPLGLSLPLALPEWKTDTRYGEVVTESNQLHLQQKGRGRALYAPLFIDFHPRRMKKTPTWRQLTVGEDLEIVSRDVAVGYRIQSGPEQWVAYRSLTSKVGNRTFIGQNSSSEFLYCRFLMDGDVETLVEIE